MGSKVNPSYVPMLFAPIAVGMSSLFFIGADRADPMPGKNERQGRSANIFFFSRGLTAGGRTLDQAVIFLHISASLSSVPAKLHRGIWR
jgi:hypothetical protein